MNHKKICVIGAGNWGKNHIKTLDQISSLGGIVDVDSKILEKYKDKYPYIQIFNDVDTAINYGFDGYVVATPAEKHYNIAKKIINSKNHILIEKPITTTMEDAIEICNLAKKKKVNLMVGHVLLFHPAFIKIKEIIDSGSIGDIQYLYSNRLNFGTIRTNENVFWSFAPHDIALFQYIIGENPISIQSSGNDIVQKGIHDTTLSVIKYPDNITGHIFVSWLHPFKEHRFIVIGSKGMLHFEDSIEGKPLYYYDKKINWESGIPVINKKSSTLIEYDFDKLPLQMELEYFIEHLDGKPVKIANSTNAIEVMNILTKVSEGLLK